MSILGNSLPEFEFYYDAGTRQYWIRNNRDGWIEIRESSLRRHLRSLGYKQKSDGDGLSQIEEALNSCQTSKDVVYAGPLAGYKSGLHEIAGARILVTTSPKFIEAVQGEWPTLRQFLENLFDERPKIPQLPVVLGWLKVAIENLYAGKFRPGQALVLAGEAGSGKSLFQTLVTELLGGRYAKPFQFMMGGTTFNGDLFEAEHLMLEDEASTTDIRARRGFGARIKDVTVNSLQRLHAKHRNAIRMKPFWRLTVSLNDEPENLMILPPMDESLEDKIILLQVRKMATPMPTQTDAQRDKFWNALIDELPAFVHFLFGWEIPLQLRSERYGVSHVHHPDLLDALNELSPEDRLLALIDQVPFDEMKFSQSWRGSAMELESLLFSSGLYEREARSLLNWNNSCAAYLGRLARKKSHRVVRKRSGGHRSWIIEAPVTSRPEAQADLPI